MLIEVDDLPYFIRESVTTILAAYRIEDTDKYPTTWPEWLHHINKYKRDGHAVYREQDRLAHILTSIVSLGLRGECCSRRPTAEASSSAAPQKTAPTAPESTLFEGKISHGVIFCKLVPSYLDLLLSYVLANTEKPCDCEFDVRFRADLSGVDVQVKRYCEDCWDNGKSKDYATALRKTLDDFLSRLDAPRA